MPISLYFQKHFFVVQACAYAVASAGLALSAAYHVDALYVRAKNTHATLLNGAPISLGNFFVLFVVVATIFFLLVKLLKNGRFLRVLFFMVLVVGWLNIGVSFGSDLFALILVGMVITLYVILPKVSVHNILLTGSIAGIAENFGMRFFSTVHTQTALLIALTIVLGVMSLYDWWAVDKSNIMVTGFKRLTDQGIFFMLLLPRSLTDIASSLRNVRRNGRYTFLGTGDIALPVLFLVGVRHMGFLPLVGALLGMLIGIVLDFATYTSQKKSVPLPALPRIALSMLCGFFTGFIGARIIGM